MDVYDRIDKLLEEKGISRRKAAQMAGINPGSLNSNLYRKKGLSASAVSALAQALEVDANYLLTGKAIETVTLSVPETGEVYTGNALVTFPKGHPLHVPTLAEQECMRNQLLEHYDALNFRGQEKAAESVELLTRVPEYLKKSEE